MDYDLSLLGHTGLPLAWLPEEIAWTSVYHSLWYFFTGSIFSSTTPLPSGTLYTSLSWSTVSCFIICYRSATIGDVLTVPVVPFSRFHWLLDFGTSLHITPDATHLYHSHPPLLVMHICTADGIFFPISSTGHLLSNTFFILSISPVPRLSINLMSISQLTDYNC